MMEDPAEIRLARQAAQAIGAAFQAYYSQLEAITRRAKERFEQRDWHGMQADAGERLDLYTAVVSQIVSEIGHLLGEHINETLMWARMRSEYARLVAKLDAWQLAETLFNSVTRRIFSTVGVNPELEFADTCTRNPPFHLGHPPYQSYAHHPSTPALIETILTDYPFQVGYRRLQQDAKLVAGKLHAHLQAIAASPPIDRTEVLTSIFYRGKGAYLVGRIFCGEQLLPFVLALLSTPEGIVVDAVLMTEDEVSVLFSFTRSYFHVDVSRPSELILFLRSIMPRKRTAELYISIGYNKHGKSELYCDLLHHLAHSDDKFEIAEGERGMVMLVFTMASFDVVFKVIKDRFDYSKNTTRQAVMEKYHLVFKHDRAGRLVDAQEFEHLRFDRERFSDELLQKLQQLASKTAVVEQDHVVIKHVYVERRVSPLNLYLRRADEGAAEAAVLDYGNAIKDLAATNIFPGDMLLKNFGVTRHRRVVFYDYDELCLLTRCNFRAMPQARTFDEEFSSEPWFPVGEDDIFPEEFQSFLGLKGTLRSVFLKYHADLFDVRFWRRMQDRIRSGEMTHIYPYDRNKQLCVPK